MAQTSAPVKKIAHLAASEEILKECDSIERDMEELKASYEQYFVGVERFPPARDHDLLKKRINNIKSTFNRTTAVQFRVQSLTSKFLTYQRLWSRTLQEIENGTYKRDLFKARLRAKQRDAGRGRDEEADIPIAVEAPAPSPTPTQSKGSPPLPQSVGGDLSDAKLRVIFEAYVNAKKRCREDVSKITFDSIVSKLRKQVPALLQKHKVKSVEVKVVIKDGKAVLRAVPKGASPDKSDEL